MAAVCSSWNTAGAQTFSIDLNRVSEIYDELYPERTQTAVWDTIPRVDLSTLTLGDLHYEVPNFLTHDFGKTKTKVEYWPDPAYEVEIEYPPVYSLEPRDSTVGAITVQVPRNLDIPDVDFRFRSYATLTEDVRRRSQWRVWRKTTREFIETRRSGQRIGKGGITIDIPIPMPRQLESLFGPSEKTHINITGREEITFAGETRVVKPFVGVEGRESQSLFPSLDMKQVLDVRLTGTIGDKVNIQVDHSSEALSDDANRIRLNYTGYEDDVIQLIELGNTSLSLPGSQLVSAPSSAGLFGVKVLAQLGSTDITVIASKQEGESSSASFSPSGGSIGSTERRVIRDIDYVKNKYFFFARPDPASGAIFGNYLPSGEDIDVYRELKGAEINELDAGAAPGRAWVDTSGTGQVIRDALAPLATGDSPVRYGSQGGWFELLDLEADYYFVYAADGITPIGIELAQPISKSEQRVLAVSFTNNDGNQVGGQRYNDLLPADNQLPAPQDTLALVMLKSRSPLPGGEFGGSWDYMMRNIYNLGMSNIDRASFTLEIEDNKVPRLNPNTPPAAADSTEITEPWIRIFGLDRTDNTGTGPPDNRIDLTSDIINLRTGTLTFPSLKPFAPDSADVVEWTGGEFWFLDPRFGLTNGEPRFADWYRTSEKIYQTDPSLQTFQNLHQYNIVVEAVSTTRTFRIDALNIIENSEVVTVDGRRLARGSEYDINYDTGEIELKGAVLSELTDASKIDIDYEYKPFGGGGSSSLVGFSTVSTLGQNARLGSTFLYESKNVSAEKPRVGEEPTRAVVGSVNGSIQHQSDALTRLVNALPLVDTDAPSSINVNGEVGVSIPDPNTRGEAYLDDFEGVEDSDRISLSRRTWQKASLPLVQSGIGTEKLDPSDRLGFIWYNLEPNLAARKRDLNPELDERENQLVTALDIELDPGLPAADDTTSFAGVMTGFAGGGLDLTQGQFIEFWVNDFKPDPADRGGKIHIDLGYIDENFYEPELSDFNDEDKAKDGFQVAYDDTGLDGLFDDEEPDLTGDPEDPAGDNIDVSRINGRFIKVNGTEGNNVYDTEDLDRSGDMDRTDAFFSFVIDLSDTAAVDIREQYPTYDGWRGEHANDSWRLYRVRLSAGQVVTNTSFQPAFEQIHHMRIWFNDVNKVVHNRADDPGTRRIQIAELKVVGNRWEDDGVRDLQDQEDPTKPTEFAIGVISTKTDPGVYVPPIRPNVENEVADKETSLFLRYEDLGDSTQVRILKRFQGNGLDLNQYRDLNFFVHADRLDPDLQYYFRLGTNETNYYEIAVPMTLEYFGGGWCQVLTKLDNLTQLKFSPADSAVTGTSPDLIEDRSYPIKMVGAPSLFTVRFLYAGVRSVGTAGAYHSGELWIDDIYVGDVRRDIDFAQRASAQLNLGGGVISLSGTWQRTGPDFRGLRQRRGRGALEQSYTFNAKTAVQHFIPTAGFLVPVQGTYAKRISRPKFVPNSDTEITDPALQDSLQTVSISRGFSTSMSKRNSKNWLLKYTVDRMSTSFSYNRTANRGPAAADTTTTMNGTLGYQLNWTGGQRIKLYKDFGIRWWLNSLDVRTSASRQTSRRWRLIGDEYRPDPYGFRASLQNSGSANYSPVPSITSTFNMNIERDVGLPHEWFGVDVGTEVRRNHNFKLNYRPPPIRFVRAFQPDINYTSQYTEDSSPNVRRPGDPRGTRNVNANHTVALKVKYDIGNTFSTIFRRMGVDVDSRDDRPPPGAQQPATGGAAGAGSAAPDTSTAPADTTSGPRADPMMLVRKFTEVLTDIRRVNFSVSQQNGSNYQRIPERPGYGYQFGLSTDTGINTPDGPVDKPDTESESLKFNADSGVELTESIDVAGRYQHTITDQVNRTSERRSVSTTFPDVQLSWKNLERLGLFGAFFTQTQATVNLKQFKQESGRRNEDPENTRTQLTFSPSLLFTWKNDIKSNLGVSYNKNTSDTRGSKTEQTSISINLDFKKSFIGGAGFKIPIPFFTKQVKWKSKLDTNLSMAYSRTSGKRFTEGSDLSSPIPSTSSIRVSPTVAYTFSDNLSGRAFIDYNRSYTETTDQTITTVRVGVTAVFTF